MRPFLAGVLLLALAAPARADVLVDNVNGLTLDAKGGVERFTGILIGDDGRIEQVLQRSDKRPAKVDYKLDGKGRVLLPGMIDSHAEVMELGFAQLTLDLSSSRSLDEALSRIAAYAAAHPDRPWVLGRGWNAEAWGLARLPTAAELDTAVGDRPVWLLRGDGAAGWANSAALAASGVSAATKDPAGGRIERVAASGRPAGVLSGTALALVQARVPSPRPEDRDLALSEAQTILLGRGVTTVADMGTTIEDWQAYRRAGDLDRLRIRIVAYAEDVDDMALIGGPGPSPWLYDDRLRLNGLNLVLDGPLAARGAALKAPYADAPAVTGTERLGGTQLRNLMSRAAIDNFQVAVDASGDAAVASVLDAIDELADTYGGDRRWRIEQLQAVDPVDLARLAKNGVIASVQPLQIDGATGMAEARLGPERLARAWPWNALARSGASLVFGSGAPADASAPLAALAVAVTRQGTDGQPFGGWQAQERVLRETALAALTAEGARALFAEGRFGRIARGQRADFILVDRDPTLATPDELRAMRVLATWVGGKPVFEAKESEAPER